MKDKFYLSIIDKFYFSETCMKDPKTSIVFLYLLALRCATHISTERLCEKTGLSMPDVAISLLTLCTEKIIKITGGAGTRLIFLEYLCNENDNAEKEGGEA